MRKKLISTEGPILIRPMITVLENLEKLVSSDDGLSSGKITENSKSKFKVISLLKDYNLIEFSHQTGTHRIFKITEEGREIRTLYLKLVKSLTESSVKYEQDKLFKTVGDCIINKVNNYDDFEILRRSVLYVESIKDDSCIIVIACELKEKSIEIGVLKGIVKDCLKDFKNKEIQVDNPKLNKTGENRTQMIFQYSIK
jgi:hypothetical protein